MQHMAQYLANMPDDAKVLQSMSCKKLGLALGKLAASHGAEKLHGVHLGKHRHAGGPKPGDLYTPDNPDHLYLFSHHP